MAAEQVVKFAQPEIQPTPGSPTTDIEAAEVFLPPAIQPKLLALKTETIVILDFGSQYSHLIARRMRECNVFCEITPPDVQAEDFADKEIKGIILSGGPNSVYDKNAPQAPSWVYKTGVPVLGICYGMHLMAHQLGGTVDVSAKREYGHAVLRRASDDGEPLFTGLGTEIKVWMSHGDRISILPPGFHSLGESENTPAAAIRSNQFYGVQFHPEVIHTPEGTQILRNFLLRICNCSATWTPASFIQETLPQIKSQVGDESVLCALSGGVDSAVAAALIHQAIGERLHCVFVDTGLMRHQEGDRVMEAMKNLGIKNIRRLNESERFFAALKGITDPEEKRRQIGQIFIRIFETIAKSLPDVAFLAQGTLYPDVIESKTSENSATHKIKTHHNVGGLPKAMNLKLVEPLRYLFKDEVRRIGKDLGIPDQILNRQPFPGPGLAIRVIGEVTPDKVAIVRACDNIVMNEIKESGWYSILWQVFAVLTNLHTVGVMGDQRTYGHVIALRAVTSVDAMTADWAQLPYETLTRISNCIINEVPAVNRVVYDITSKPPGTIEWE